MPSYSSAKINPFFMPSLIGGHGISGKIIVNLDVALL